MNESLDSRQLEAFVALSKTGSFTEAAKQLYVTHSAISHSMKALENEVGCRLLSKLRKKTILTEAGEAFLQPARRALDEMRQARLAVAELNQWGSRRLRLAADAILLSNFLTPIISQFHGEFPRTSIDIQACGPGEAISRLKNGRVDLALSAAPPTNEQFEFVPLFADRFQMVISAAHPLATQTSVPRAELAKFPCILLSGSGHERGVVDNFLSRSGLALDIIGEIEGLELVKSMVAQSRLISLLPRWCVTTELKNQSLITLRVGRKPFEQTWGLVYAASHTLNHVESTLLKLCRKQVAKLA